MRSFASDKEKQILDTLSKTLLKMDDREKDRLLAFAEGMAFKAEQQEVKDAV